MKVRVINHMSLDGVIQSPSGLDEDRRGGFDQGGWAVPNNDEVMARVMGEGMAEGGPLLFGRLDLRGVLRLLAQPGGQPDHRRAEPPARSTSRRPR